MRLTLGVGLQLLQLLALSAGAFAQAQPPADAPCVPSCRTGFMCQSGVCISACNPPCPAGQACTAQGECASAAPQYLAPPLPAGYPIAGYQPVPELPDAGPAGSREHDGFMLRGVLGGGGNWISQSWYDSNRTIEAAPTGVSGELSIDVGFAPVTNFSLLARLGFGYTPSPGIDGDSALYVDANIGRTVRTYLFALGMTYYFMPINIYLSGAAGLAVLAFDDDDDDDRRSTVERSSADSTASGLGLHVDVGKEWWVSNAWGLGAAVRGSFVSGSGENAGARYDYSAWGLYLLFSITFQ